MKDHEVYFKFLQNPQFTIYFTKTHLRLLSWHSYLYLSPLIPQKCKLLESRNCAYWCSLNIMWVTPYKHILIYYTRLILKQKKPNVISLICALKVWIKSCTANSFHKTLRNAILRTIPSFWWVVPRPTHRQAQ